MTLSMEAPSVLKADTKSAGIQMLRGILTWMVLMSHFVGMIADYYHLCGRHVDLFALWKSPLHILWGGEAAVVCFFLLTGFFYAKSYAKRPVKSFGGAIQWIGKRILRLYPAIFVVTILTFGIRKVVYLVPFEEAYYTEWFLEFWRGSVGLKELGNGLMLRGNLDVFDPPLWTMRIDFNMIIPSLILLWLYYILPPLKKVERLKNLLVVLIIIFISQYISSFRYLFIFAIGMLLDIYIDYFEQWKRWILLFIGLLGISFGYYVCESGNNYIFTISWCFIIIYACRKKVLNNRGAKLLIFIGDNSYGVYLIHFIVLLCLRYIIPLRTAVALGIYYILFIVLSLFLGKVINTINMKMYNAVCDYINIMKGINV